MIRSKEYVDEVVESLVCSDWKENYRFVEMVLLSGSGAGTTMRINTSLTLLNTSRETTPQRAFRRLEKKVIPPAWQIRNKLSLPFFSSFFLPISLYKRIITSYFY